MTDLVGGSTSRGRVLAWATWNAGAAGFHAVILTFVFSVYLTRVVGRHLPGPIGADAWLGFAVGAAGLLVALSAPVVGQHVDSTGRRKRTTLVWTALTVASMTALVAVRPDWHWLAPGLVLIGLGSLCAELATVPYNAMLSRLSTPATIGRVSGFGWAMGYFGGVVLLIVVWVGLVAGQGGVLGAPTDDGFNIRLVALVGAVWFAVLAVPLFVVVPETAAVDDVARPGLTEAYRRLGRDLRELFATDRAVLVFLGASALYRDGLAAVAVFGAVLGVTVFDLEASEVLLFGVVADLVAAAGAFAGGVLEDRIGPKRVVLGSLAGLLLAGVVLQLGSGPAVFWIVGLTLTLFVGPVQSSSRTFLARLAPAGRDGQVFGLYAAAGRATSFLAPTLFGLLVAVTGATRAGMLGILLVVAAGAVALVPVRVPRSGAPGASRLTPGA